MSKLAGVRPAPGAKDVPMAVALMLAACALIAGTTLIAKMLGPASAGENALHPLQVTAGRFAFAFMALVPFIAWLRIDFRNTDWTNHLLRVLFGWAGVTCLFAASALMRLADATAISFLNPIVAMILSIPLLGEKVGPWRWAGAAVAFAGAAILTEPGTDAFQPVALIALLAAVFMGVEVVLIKRLSDREPPLRILFLSNGLGALVSLCAAILFWKWPLPGQWWLLATLGVTMVTVQALFIQAAKRGDASFVTPFFYTTLIFAGLYDYLVFSVTPTPNGWIGAALIIAGALTIVWRERVQRRRDVSLRRLR